MSFLNHIKKLDFLLIFAASALAIIGIIFIYSACISSGNFFDTWRQIGFFVFGFLLMIGISFFDNRTIRENSFLILTLYFLCVLSLVGLFFFAPEIRGIKSWYRIGPITFDPTELTKIILIILLAKYFSKRHVELYKIKHIFLSGLYAFIPSILIFFQPEFGSVMVIVAIWIGILLVSGIKLKDFILLCLLSVLALSLVWSFLIKDYQRDRMINFINPQENALGGNWNSNQALIAIGSGGLIGKGLGNGSQVQNKFLPEAKTDFIFSVVAEETGLVGTTAILSLFGILFWRILRIALNARSNFSRLFATGLSISIFFQMFINIGMNLGLLPVIGLPLPLVSYGGSNIVFTFIALGLLQNMMITES
jgi:rod shape determining protein RodA